MMSLQQRVARLHRSIAARLRGLSYRAQTLSTAASQPPRLESLEDRLLLSATLLVDAGTDQNADEGQQLSFTGTFEDTDTGGGTPGTFDVLQLTATAANERQLDIDGNRAVWESNGDIFFFDGTFDGLGAPNIVNITNSPIGEAGPHISGDHIVYTGGGLFAYNINTQTTIQIAPSTASLGNLDIDGDTVVWTERPGSFFTVMMADLSAATPTPTVVKPIGSGVGANGNQFTPKVSGNLIVWEAPGVGGFNDVFLHDLNNPAGTINLSNSPVEEDTFQINDGVAVWSDFNDVFYYDSNAATPAVVNIGSAGIQDRLPQISGRNIVWDGATAAGGNVFHHNLDTAVTTILTDSLSPFLTEPRIDGDNVVWSDGNEVFIHNLAAGTNTNLSNSAVSDIQPLVSGNNVVWLSRTTLSNNDIFFATGQADPPSFTFDWDFGDGTVLTDTTLEQTHAFADNGAFSVTLTVTASDGRVTTDTLIANIDNVAPDVAPIAGASQGLRGQTFSFSGSFTDPGAADTHTTAWTVTDSLGTVVATGAGSSIDFTPEDAGAFDVTFTVTDDDGGVGSATTTTTALVILVAQDPIDPSLTTVQIAGTNGRDVIHVQASTQTPGALLVTVHEVTNGITTTLDNITGIDRILAYGYAGDDQIKVFQNAGTLPSELFGGEGNDLLRGGLGVNYINGGAGDDLIAGLDNRDLLIGGTGQDLIQGNMEDDLLIGGVYQDADDLTAIRALLAEWTRTDLDYLSRINNLTNGTGFNGGFVLNDTTVFDDFAVDKLFGMQGLDWFLADADDRTDEKRDEVLTETQIAFIDVDVDYVV